MVVERIAGRLGSAFCFDRCAAVGRGKMLWAQGKERRRVNEVGFVGIAASDVREEGGYRLMRWSRMLVKTAEVK